MGVIKALCISEKRGTQKFQIDKAEFRLWSRICIFSATPCGVFSFYIFCGVFFSFFRFPLHYSSSSFPHHFFLTIFISHTIPPSKEGELEVWDEKKKRNKRRERNKRRQEHNQTQQ